MLVDELELDSEVLQNFKCGHSFAKEALAATLETQLDLSNISGTKKARPYQAEGVRFGLDSLRKHGGLLNGDQMRLGKTPQGLLIAKNFDQWPILILVRAANIFQWVRESKDWVNNLPSGVWVIQGTKNWIPPGFSIYIMSMDTFGRRGTCKSCEHQFHDDECRKKGCNCRVCLPAGDAMSDLLLEFGFKLVIVDEAHSFKNTDSNRSQALTCFLKTIERSETVQEIPFTCMVCKEQWTETITIKTSSLEETKRVSKTSHCPKCFAQQSQSSAAHVKVTRNCGIVCLTGTPIKNRADELFVPLNLIAPERFPSLSNFRQTWLEQNSKGAYTRVKDYKYEDFKKAIAPFYIRREKEDIYTDLPKFTRIFTPIEISDERLVKAYNKVLDTLEEKLNKGLDYFSSIGELQQLRQICGLGKVQWAADYAETFVADSEKQKLAIGVHHHSVRDAMSNQLESFGVCKLDGQDSPARKDYVAHKYFQTSPEQILLLGMMAAKEGLELVYIDTALVLEREWSAAEEEQFEYRFYNPDLGYLASRGLTNKTTTIEYLLAKKTIDWFFYELVEEKRQIFGETIGTNWDITKDPTSWRQLIEQTVGSRL